MSEISPTLCPLPWTHLFIGNSGKMPPCCYAQSEEIEAQSAQVQNLSSIEDFFNSNQKKEIRQFMLKGLRHSACRACYEIEDQGRKSPRNFHCYDYNDEIPKMIADTDEHGTCTPVIKSFDLRLGNQCNLKCRMCGPSSSRQLIKEFETSDKKNFVNQAQKAKEQAWEISEETWSVIFNSSKELEKVYFGGGEPSLIEAHYKLLDRLIELNLSQNIKLIYSTNLTRILPNLENYLRHFKSIQLSLSIDGYGQLNNYIRYPTKWEQVTKHLHLLDDVASRHSNLLLMINTTVQAFNVTRISELLNFLKTQNFRHINWVPEFAMVTEPIFLAIQMLPKEIKTLAVERYNTFRQHIGEVEGEWNQSRLQDFEKILQAMFLSEDLDHRREFIRVTRWQDAFRKQNVLDHLPEFSGLFGEALVRGMKTKESLLDNVTVL